MPAVGSPYSDFPMRLEAHPKRQRCDGYQADACIHHVRIKLVHALQETASKDFLQRVFVPKASSAGAKVTASMLHSESDGSTSIGQAICQYVHQAKPDALILMKQNKNAVTRFFIGSVTRYCATECDIPVVIVPP